MISPIRHAWASLTALSLTTLFVLGPATALMAQEAGGEEAAGPNWVLPYILCGLFVALGVFAVCFQSNRQIEELRRKELREMQEKNKAG